MFIVTQSRAKTTEPIRPKSPGARVEQDTGGGYTFYPEFDP